MAPEDNRMGPKRREEGGADELKKQLHIDGQKQLNKL
jgi:hypothetical protein